MGRKKNKTEKRRPVSGIAFFLAGIFIICLSLILSNCGKSEQKSIELGGPFAIDLSLAPIDKQGLVVLVNPNGNHPSLDETEFTVEAWVKSKTATLNGSIYSRFSSDEGIALYIKDNFPKFTLRFPGTATGTDYIVESDAAVSEDEWHHIAAVLVDENHSSIHQDCTDRCSTTKTTTCTLDADCPIGETCVTDAETERPHLDIYVDGTFQECATTGSQFATKRCKTTKTTTCTVDADCPLFNVLECSETNSTTCTVDADCPTGETCISVDTCVSMTGTFDKAFLGRMDVALDGLDTTTRFDGIIDEVRLYRVAKTEAEINATKDRELINSGEFASDDLISYWSNNIGKGSVTPDNTGAGYNGTIWHCVPPLIPPDCTERLSDGWVRGDWP